MSGPLCLIVTRRCPQRCVYCPVEHADVDLAPAKAVDAVRRHADRGGTLVRLTGGEPAAHWPAVDAVLQEVRSQRRRGRELSVELCTSGVLLDRERIAALDRPWIQIVISVDGPPAALAAAGRQRAPELGRVLALDRTAVTQTIAPARAHRLVDDLLYLRGLGARRLGLLPVVHRPWTAVQLRALAEGLEAAAAVLAADVAAGRVEVRNLTRRGVLPLFNDDITVDADGTWYRTNVVLCGALAVPLLPDLQGRPGHVPPLPADLRQRLEQRLPARARHSNRAVDGALSRFVAALVRPAVPRADRPPAVPSSAPGRLEFHISYDCDNRCVFCSEEHRLKRFGREPVSVQQIWRVLRRRADGGVRHVLFTGGEPTAHPGFVAALRLARHLGLRAAVGTNGSVLCQPDVAAEALPLLDELSLSIHGSTARCHDTLTGRRGSFDQLMRLAELAREAEPGPSLVANAVVTTRNADDVEAVVALCGARGIDRLLVSNLAPEGRGLDRYAELALSLSRWRELAPRVDAAARAASLRVRYFGLPLCALGEARARSNDLYFDARLTVERQAGPGSSVRLGTVLTRTPRRHRRFTRRCRGCVYRALCGGVFDAYLELFGDAEIVAQRL